MSTRPSSALHIGWDVTISKVDKIVLIEWNGDHCDIKSPKQVPGRLCRPELGKIQRCSSVAESASKDAARGKWGDSSGCSFSWVHVVGIRMQYLSRVSPQISSTSWFRNLRQRSKARLDVLPSVGNTRWRHLVKSDSDLAFNVV
jgi:hypothetical protein